MAFACENISTDPGGRITFVNLIDTLLAVSFPTMTPQVFIVFAFYGQLAGLILQPRISIEKPTGEKLAETVLKDLPITTDTPIVRAIVGFQGIQWPSSGRYIVKFAANGNKILASFPLLLTQHNVTGTPQRS